MNILVFILGLCVGSFLNCVIWRLHTNKTIWGRSICPKCKKKIVWYDNIPVASFLWLKGKCRRCKKPISVQYPMVEIATGVLFLLAFINYQFSITNYQSIFNNQFSIQVLRDWFFISVLVIIFVYDLRWYLILDKVTLPAMVVALVLNIVLGFSVLNLLIVGIIGGGFFLLQYVVSKGKWIGGGDIRLGALMGLMIGWPGILISLMLAYIVGGIIGILLLISGKKKWSSQIPFGTFLSAATVAVLLWGREISEWYFELVI